MRARIGPAEGIEDPSHHVREARAREVRNDGAQVPVAHGIEGPIGGLQGGGGRVEPEEPRGLVPQAEGREQAIDARLAATTGPEMRRQEEQGLVVLTGREERLGRLDGEVRIARELRALLQGPEHAGVLRPGPRIPKQRAERAEHDLGSIASPGRLSGRSRGPGAVPEAHLQGRDLDEDERAALRAKTTRLEHGERVLRAGPARQGPRHLHAQRVAASRIARGPQADATDEFQGLARSPGPQEQAGEPWPGRRRFEPLRPWQGGRWLGRVRRWGWVGRTGLRETRDDTGDPGGFLDETRRGQ